MATMVTPLLALLVVTVAYAAPATTNGNCLRSCSGQNDGDYQSCLGCHVYASCVNGVLTDNRPCASDLVWDDTAKTCQRTSTTCAHNASTPAQKTTTTPLPRTTSINLNTSEVHDAAAIKDGSQQERCVSNCVGLLTGNYQSCQSCHVYASCVNGQLIDNRPCPSDLVWDDILKVCQFTSTTCSVSDMTLERMLTEKVKDSQCISSCEGLKNGNYPSCFGHEFFASCSNGVLTDLRPCPVGLVWDDRIKACNYPHLTYMARATMTGHCVKSCRGLPSGDYQSCKGCSVYATCNYGQLYDYRPCPAGLFWDDRLKRCEYTSRTCPASAATPSTTSGFKHDFCVTSCWGMRSGNYPSCNGCHLFATCTNGNLIDNRPCPVPLVWNDYAKICSWTSSSCQKKNANMRSGTQRG